MFVQSLDIKCRNMDIVFKIFGNRCKMLKNIMLKNIKEDKLMKVKKYFGKGVMKCLNVLALLLVMQTANSACIWVAHQPKFPEAANKFKFKM